MSGELDKKMRALAENMLKKFGRKGTITRAGVQSYNDDTGKTTTGTGVSIDIDFYIDSDRTSTLRESGLILKNESIVLIAAKQAEIIEQDSLYSGDISTTIISFTSIWSGAKIALYEAVVVV